jgi:hypothetical protein
MISRIFAIAAGAIAAAAICGCAAVPHTITLASGTRLNVIEEKSETYTDRHNVEKHMFTVQYESAEDFQNRTAVRDEMYAVFDFYKPRIDQDDDTKFDLTPMKRDLGGGWEGLPFYLERRPSGRWIVL